MGAFGEIHLSAQYLSQDVSSRYACSVSLELWSFICAKQITIVSHTTVFEDDTRATCITDNVTCKDTILFFPKTVPFEDDVLYTLHYGRSQ